METGSKDFSRYTRLKDFPEKKSPLHISSILRTDPRIQNVVSTYRLIIMRSLYFFFETKNLSNRGSFVPTRMLKMEYKLDKN